MPLRDGDAIPWLPYRDYITSLILEDSVTNIVPAAFNYCTKLDNVYISENLTEIGASSFVNTGKLIGMRFPSGVTEIPAYCFESSAITADTLEIPSNIATINFYAFRYCDNIKHLVLPESITDLSGGQFTAMMGIEDVVFYGIQTLGGAFVECPSLKWVYLPASIRSISLMEFYVRDYSSSFTDIYYAGTQAQWNNVNKNFILIHPTVHYSASMPSA